MSKLLGLSWIIEQTEKVTAKDHWSRLARFSLLLDLLEFREKLVLSVLKNNQESVTDIAIEQWATSKKIELNRLHRVLDDLKVGTVHIDKLYFANRQLKALVA